MPRHPHIEKHFTAGDAVRDVVIGMSDGLTVPFALAAGLTGAISQTHVIVTAGVAEIAAGSIAMGSEAFSRPEAMPSTTATRGRERSTRSWRCPRPRHRRSAISS